MQICGLSYQTNDRYDETKYEQARDRTVFLTDYFKQQSRYFSIANFGRYYRRTSARREIDERGFFPTVMSYGRRSKIPYNERTDFPKITGPHKSFSRQITFGRLVV